MNVIHYVGLDVHEKTISYCIKTAACQIVEEVTLKRSPRVFFSATTLWCPSVNGSSDDCPKRPASHGNTRELNSHISYFSQR
jgi:hypothetical protein